MPNQSFYPCQGYVAPWKLAKMPPHTPVLLAFSGGADSRALLHLLYASSQADGFPLTVAHVNHGIRGEEALRDRDFCVSLAQSYGVELCVLDADIPTLAATHHTGLEEEARAVRYAYFERLMREKNIPILVTAHHADDHLETLLFRLCRGTGLRGLGGIAPVRSVAEGQLVRPLLHCTRREILDYCEQNNLEYVTDSTNTDTAYARNRIRAEVIPVLETMFENLQVRAVDMSETLREDEAYLTQLARSFLDEYALSRRLDAKALLALPMPLRKRALRMWLSAYMQAEPEGTHLSALLLLVEKESESQTRVALPGGIVVVREFGYLCLLPQNEKKTDGFCFPFTLGETVLGDSGIRIYIEKLQHDRKIHNLSTQSCINSCELSDIINKDFYWRSRREGDTLLLRGMHRKLRKLYNSAKLPVRWRDRLPLLCDSEGIVWAPFVGCRDGMSNEGERYMISVSISECEHENN